MRYYIYDGFQSYRGDADGSSPENALVNYAHSHGTTGANLVNAGWSARVPPSENNVLEGLGRYFEKIQQ